MRYSIGYQLPDEYDSTVDICRDYRKNISDVYFSWGSEASGRLPLCDSSGADADVIEQIQLQELKEIRDLGITLTLLLNANCYGEQAISKQLRDRVSNLVGYLKKEIDITNITTTSPFIAEVIRKDFGDSVRIRASVNMRVDNIYTMKQLSGYFDGFYMRKECNRDFSAIESLTEWCNNNGKTLHMLANSGCLSHCGFQTFHDNLVAHQNKFFDENDVPQKYPSPCWKYLSSLSEDEALEAVIQASWIRPEDIHRYEKYFSEVKLATRMHSRPRMVVAAYARERFKGNLMDLTEPSYSPLFKGTVLDNTLLGDDWFECVSTCDRMCQNCNFCRDTIRKIKIFLR